MLFRFAAPGGRAAPTTPEVKSVAELLAELAEVRTKKAELTRREGEIVAAAQARLLQEQQALEGLKKKVSECGIEVHQHWEAPAVATVNAPEVSTNIDD
jgi:hypothetical protein